MVRTGNFRKSLMKVFKQLNGEQNTWLSDASKLHHDIKHAKVDIEKTFPRKEFVRSLNELDYEMGIKVIEFLGFDTSRLIKKSELEKILQAAKKMNIDRGNILHSELLKIDSQVDEIKTMISLYSETPHKTYAEAKHLFSKILQTGVWIEEAHLIKRVIMVNKKIEKLLNGTREECRRGLGEITENLSDCKFIDSGFKRDIASKIKEIDYLQKKIDSFFSKPSLELRDYQDLEAIVRESETKPYFVLDIEHLDSLYKSFKWVLELSCMMNIKNSVSLPAMVSQLIGRISQLKDKPEFEKFKTKLLECLRFTYTQHPLVEIVLEVKFIFWNIEAKQELEKGHYHLKDLVELLGRAPTHPNTSQYHSSGIFKTLKNIVAKAHQWSKEVQRLVRQASELRACPAEEFNRRMSTSLPQIEEVVAKVYEEYKGGLFQIEEFEQMRGELDLADRVLTMCKCLHKINVNKKIEHTDYQKAKELFKDEVTKKKKMDPLMDNFRQLLKIFNKEMKMLKEFYLKVSSKETHATPNLYEPKFLKYAKSLHNIDSLVEALNKVEDYIYFGDFGSIVKRFISDFKKAEAQLLEVTRENKISDLQNMDLSRIQSVAQDFETKKQRMHVRVNSVHLDELARFEWMIHAVNSLRSEQTKLEILEGLKSSSEIIGPEDKDILQHIKNKTRRGKNLYDEVQQVLSTSKGLTIEDLRDIKMKLDSSDILFKGLKKSVDEEFAAYQLIERDYQESKNTSEEAYLNTLDELKVLLKEVQTLKYAAANIQEELISTISISEKIMLSVEENNHGGELLELISKYQSVGVRCKEVENILRQRMISLDFLERPDFNIEKMQFRELAVLEKSLVNCLDPNYSRMYFDNMIKRKVSILIQLEKKSSDNLQPIINISGLEFLVDLLKKKSGLATTEEMDNLNEKIDHTKLYLKELKKLKEDVLKKCKKVLFNYLDVSEEIDQMLRSFIKEPEKNKPIDETKEKSREKDNKVAIIEEPVEKNEKRILRKQIIRSLRNTLQKIFLDFTKEEASNKARAVEIYIFNQTKNNIEDYKKRVSDYERLLLKTRQKPFLAQMLITRPISPGLVETVLGDSKEEFISLADEMQARRYLRSFDVTYNTQKVSTSQEIKDDSCIGKRRPQTAFDEEDMNIIWAGSKKIEVDNQGKGFDVMEDKISLDKSSVEAKRLTHEISDVDDDGMEIEDLEVSTKKKNGKVRRSATSHSNETISKMEIESLDDQEDSGTVVDQSEGVCQNEDKPYAISESLKRHDDDDSNLDFEMVESDKFEELVKENKLTVINSIANCVKEDKVVDEEVSVLEAVQKENTNNSKPPSIHITSAFDRGNNNVPIVSKIPEKWNVYQGPIQFSLSKKTIPHVKLISLSSIRQISKVPDFQKECLLVEERQLTLKEFEVIIDNLKQRIEKQEAFTISGLLYEDNKKSKVLKELKKTKKAVFSSKIGEGLSLYLAGPGEVSPSTRFIFDHLVDLESVQCEFVWVLIVEIESDIQKKLVVEPCKEELRLRDNRFKKEYYNTKGDTVSNEGGEKSEKSRGKKL